MKNGERQEGTECNFLKLKLQYSTTKVFSSVPVYLTLKSQELMIFFTTIIVVLITNTIDFCKRGSIR